MLTIRQPVFQELHGLPAKSAERVLLRGRQLARDPVDDAKGPERLSLRSDEGHAGIKANVRGARDQRAVGKPVILGGVRHDEQVRLENGMGAKGDVAGCFGRVDADFRFEPLPVCIDQADERNRYVADLCRESGQVVERVFGIGIQDLVALEGGQARGFVFWQGAIFIEPSRSVRPAQRAPRLDMTP